MGNDDIQVLVKENWTLMSPGIANNLEYDAFVIEDAYKNTIWDRKTCSLFIDHYPNQVDTWVGEIKNPHIENGELKGDVYIYDINLINKIKAGAKFGISPELEGIEEDGKMQEFKFLNFSVVFEPAVKTTYLNSDNDGVKHIRTRYLNANMLDDCEVLVEQIVDPDPNYFHFIDSNGNLCRRRVRQVDKVGKSLSMAESKKKLETDENDVEKKPEEEAKEEQKEEQKEELSANQLAKIAELLEQLVKDNKEIKDELKKKEKYPYPYPYPEVDKKKKKDSEKLQDEESQEEPPKEESEKPQPAEEKQVLSEELPEGLVEALKEINSEYAEFVKEFIKKHKGEGSVAELMKRAAKEWKEMKKEEQEEKAKQELQENRQTVKEADGPEKIEVALEELDKELAEYLLSQERPMSKLEV